jgi:hypothetical protein
MKKVTPLDAPTLFGPSEARCWSIGWNDAVDAMNADQPAAVPTGAGGNARAFVCCEGVDQHKPGCTADQQSAAVHHLGIDGKAHEGAGIKCGTCNAPDQQELY